MSSILTSDKLIRSIKRRSFTPNSQETFSDADFLEIATEEMNFGILPLMMKAQEEHLVYSIDVPFIQGITRYSIPSRAHGNKLRDLAILDSNGNVYETFRYSLDEISDFNNSNSKINSRGFYIQNNEVVLLGEGETNYEFLRFYVYLRPNALVPFDQGAVSVQATTELEIDNINPVSLTATSISVGATPIITVPDTSSLTSGHTVQLSGSDSTPSVDGNWVIAITSSTTFTISGITITVAGTSASVSKLLECSKMTYSKLPKTFSTNMLFDFVQSEAPNKILHWDIPANNIDFVSKTISFPKSLLPKLKVGDFTSLAEQTIVPNIPVELHPLLAQRVAVACLESMGDEQGKTSAERKLKEMETSVMTLIDNRVEGANVKIKNRHGVLREATRSVGRNKFNR